MSLIHWWPLTGDLEDKIGGNNLHFPVINDVDYNRGYIVSDANGKVGTCYARTATAQKDFLRTINKIKPLTEETLCGWFLVTQWANKNTANGLVTHHNHNTNSGLGIGMYTSDGEKYYTSVNAGNGSKRIHSDANYRGTTDINGSWHHICLTYKNGTIRMYVDGKEEAMKSNSYSLYNTEDYLDLFNWSTGHYTSADYRPVCKINDVRIYDHALKAEEVREIAKALALQYNFNNIYAESTTNLISSLKQGGRTTYDSTNMTITTTGLDQDTYFYLKTSEALIEGTTYTLTCWGENIGEGKKFTFGMQGQTTSHHQFTIKDGYNELTFVANSYVNGLTEILMDDTSRTGWQNNAVFSKFQLEKRDYATPYVRGTRNGLGIEDESGYGHDTAIYNNSALTIDTNSGSFGFRTRGSEDRTAHASCSYLKADLGTSITPTAFTIAFNAKVNVWGAQTSGALSLNVNSPEPIGYLTSTFVQYDSNFRLNNSADGTQKSISAGIMIKNEWHHYAFTWDGKVLKGYRDGSQYGSDVAAEFVPDPFRYVFLGYDRAGGAGRDADVTWGDFRLYMTALGAEEILDLAKTKGYIIENGDIACGEFVEQFDNIINEADFAIPATATDGNGTIEFRNGVMAYGLQANRYWYGSDTDENKNKSNSIFHGKFKENTQYYFDLYIDVDSMWYAGGSKYVPGGFTIRYTDGTSEDVVATSVNGTSGWQHIQHYTKKNATVYGLGIYYYIGNRWYLRHDSGIYEITNSQAEVRSTSIIDTTQLTETGFEDSAEFHISGNIVGQELIEI